MAKYNFKNKDIHFGLDKVEIRNFLASSLVRIHDEKVELNKQKQPEFNNSEVGRIENEIEILNRRLQIAKDREAIVRIIAMLGWEEFDVSDETINSSNTSLWWNFIGTQEEYDSLIAFLEKNNKN